MKINKIVKKWCTLFEKRKKKKIKGRKQVEYLIPLKVKEETTTTITTKYLFIRRRSMKMIQNLFPITYRQQSSVISSS